ncbi:MAG: MbcA/ParS/Xre antitoxin family protein [Pseudomonas sp.]
MIDGRLRGQARSHRGFVWFAIITNDNKVKADTWLNQPKAFLGGRTPLQTAHSEAEYELVRAELEKLSHGFAC